MAKRRRRKKRFRMQPRFFLLLFGLAAVVVVTIFLVKKIQSDGTDDTEAAAATALPTATPAPTATPKPALPDNVTVVRAESANPSTLGFNAEIQANRKSVSTYSRSEKVSFGRDTEYTALPGILTFGGNNYRNSFTYGIQNVAEKRLKEQWSKAIGAIDTWSGTGWTGQPLIVHWPDETLRVMNVADEFKQQEGGLTEVIYPAMDGSIYFLEMETGKVTRGPIMAGVVQKGTACLDPRGYPILYVGQGIPVKNDEGNNTAYVRVYSLIDLSEMTKLGGFDYFSRRAWQAYDSSPMISGDTIVYGGENGLLYSTKLNASFDPAAGTVSIKPEQLVKYKYGGTGYSKTDGADARWYGVESSVAAFRNFAFFTDNGGRLQCVDLNTLQLKYVVDVTDETDSTVVVEESYDDSTVYLYTASQVKSGNGNMGSGYGYSYMRKINGLTGAVIWEQKQLCSIGDSANSGGTLATPHAGRFASNVSNLVFFSVSLAARTTGGTAPDTAGDTAAADTDAGETASADTAAASYTLGGRILALDKSTGEIVWSVEQDDDYWSSPVVIYDGSSRAYLIQCDRGGVVTMYDAATGSQLATVDLGSRIDSTPAVYGDYLVVGTRGKGGAGKAAKISCVKIS